MNFCLSFSPSKYLDRQTNFKLSHGNTINNSMIMNTRPFQQQIYIYINIGAIVKKYREIKELLVQKSKNKKKI